MIKRIIDVSKTQPGIIDTSKTEAPIDPAVIAAALGAEIVGTVEGGGSHLGMISRAMEYGKRSQAAAAIRQKIPVSDAQWKQLDDLAAALSSNGSAAAPGQVAGAVLSIALRSLAAASEEQRAALVQELAALSNGAAQPDANPADTGEV